MSILTSRLASRLAATALAVCATLCLVAFADAAAAPLRRGLTEPVATLDPQRAATPEARLIARDLYEGLVTLDARRRPVPGAARLWEVLDEGRTYLFHLRPDGRWSTGERVTAQAFVVAFRRVAAEGDARTRALLHPVANAAAVAAGRAPPESLGVEAVDDATLRLRLAAPQPAILAALADVAFSPAPPGGSAELPVSNGPFRAAAWTGDRLILTRNPHHRAAPALDEVHYVALDRRARLDAYRRGELDTVPVIDQDLAWAQETLADELQSSDLAAGAYVLVSARAGPLAEDANLRRALSLALDRDALTRSVSPPGLRPTDALLPAPVAGYAPEPPSDRSIPLAERRIRAAELTAGLAVGEMRLCFDEGRGPARRQVLAAGLIWRLALGLALRPVPALRGDAPVAEACDLRAVTLHHDVADPWSVLAALAATLGPELPEAVAERLAAAGAEADPSRRAERLREAERALLASHRIIPLWQEVAHHLVKPRVAGWSAADPFRPSRLLSLRE